jgi:predicted RNA-binding Zn-ribbon protein involved in translation (DUF1610 family)
VNGRAFTQASLVWTRGLPVVVQTRHVVDRGPTPKFTTPTCPDCGRRHRIAMNRIVAQSKDVVCPCGWKGTLSTAASRWSQVGTPGFLRGSWTHVATWTRAVEGGAS